MTQPRPPQRMRLLAPLAWLAPWFMGTRASAGDWPARPIRLVVPFPPGGSSDILGRLVAEHLTRALGGTASLFVDNKPGGTAQIGTEWVARAAPDGHTLLLGSATTFTMLPNFRQLGYSLDSFDCIGGVADYLAVLAVRPSLGIRDMGQFVDYAKRNPGKLSYGSTGEASAGHVYGATLAHGVGLALLHVPFRGSVAAVNALVAGDIDFIIDGAVTPMVQAGRVLALATLYRQRHPLLPDVPTLAEAGFSVVAPTGASWGLLAPRGTPAEARASLSAALRKTLEQKDLQESCAQANAFAAWRDPADLRAGLLADQAMYRKLLPAIGVGTS